MARFRHAGDFDLQSFDRRIHISHRATGTRLLSEHVPRFERLPQFDVDALRRDRSVERETELQVRREPLWLQREAVPAEIAEDILEVLGHEVRQHEAVVQLRVPANQRLIVGALPEAGDERAQEQLLREAHPRVRRHLERSQLHEALATAARFRRVELVDAELGPVGVARQIDEQMSEHAIHEPWRRIPAPGDLRERDLQLVQRIVPRLHRLADADWSGRKRARRTGTTATDGCASSRADCVGDPAAAGKGCPPASGRRVRCGCHRRCRCGGRRA